MDKKVWGIIIVILSLVLIIGIAYIIFFYRFSSPASPAVQPPVTQEPAVQPPAAEEPGLPAQAGKAVQPIVPAKPAEMRADDLARLASAFAERFGSFSNQSDYGNIRDLQIFMTDTMKTWAENYINDARTKKIQTVIYYGIVTKAISNEVKNFDADTGQAEILVKTQRRELAGVSGNSSTFYQDIIIKYAREQGVWRVDKTYWQSK
ncbi:MAG: hypothetical protein HYV53_03945 [Parcubacteria group bacterium]|nr:hypothetical protein [Parcubacteria group bacterium]